MTSKIKTDLRLDHKIIGEMIEPRTMVLDMGCGDGELLEYLVAQKNVKGSGVEISEEAIYRCVKKGLSVSQGDIDSGLKEYPDDLFDYVIFNQTMQQVNHPKEAILESLRIGKKVIVGFPNFCNINARFQLFFGGHVPVTAALPYSWYNTPNRHCLGVKDFRRFCDEQGITIEKNVFVAKKNIIKVFPNIFAFNAIFQISKL